MPIVPRGNGPFGWNSTGRFVPCGGYSHGHAPLTVGTGSPLQPKFVQVALQFYF